jgi:hypothetical protein
MPPSREQAEPTFYLREVSASIERIATDPLGDPSTIRSATFLTLSWPGPGRNPRAASAPRLRPRRRRGRWEGAQFTTRVPAPSIGSMICHARLRVIRLSPQALTDRLHNSYLLPKAAARPAGVTRTTHSITRVARRLGHGRRRPRLCSSCERCVETEAVPLVTSSGCGSILMKIEAGVPARVQGLVASATGSWSERGLSSASTNWSK